MSNFLIDVPLLACPNPMNFEKIPFQEIFWDFLMRLSDISKLREDCTSANFWRDNALAETLFETNAYPFRHALSIAMENLFDPGEFQLEDLNILTTALLERSLLLEDEGLVQDVVVSQCILNNDPVSNRSKSSQELLCQLACLAVSVLGDTNKFSANVYLLTANSRREVGPISLNFRVDVLVDNDGIYSEPQHSKAIDLAVYKDSEYFYENVDLIHLWSNSNTKSIIDSCAFQASRSEIDKSATIVYVKKCITIGTKFVSSAKTLGFMHDEKKIGRLLRVCADLAMHRNLAKSHWLRKGAGANEPQKVKGEWCAWRHDIDDEFHLHYWRDGDKVEFANVVVHNDFSID